MIWLLGAGLVLVALILLLRPLFFAGVGQALSAFDEGHEAEARAAAARRLLAEAAAHETARPLRAGARNTVVAVVALVIPAVGLGLYGLLGHPQAIAVQAPPPPQDENLAILADQLGERLVSQGAAAPAKGWALYGRTLHQLGRYQAAADAFGQAAMRDPQNALYVAGQAEAMVFAASGTVTAAAAALFTQIMALDQTDPSARYYLALADLQAGQADAAYQAFGALAADTPSTAPYFAAVQDRLADAAKAAGKPVPPRPVERTGPSADDVAAAADMSADERMQMIRTMVDGLASRLEETPDDLMGWRRLGGARAVLQEWDAAATAYLQVLRLNSGDDGAISALKDIYPRLASGPLKDRVSAEIQ